MKTSKIFFWKGAGFCLCLLMALWVFITFSACNISIDTARQSYEKAVALQEQEKGFSCEFENKVTIYPKEEASTPSVYYYSGSVLSDGEEVETAAIAIHMSFRGETLNSQIYFSDGWCYIDSMGVKMKKPMEQGSLSYLGGTQIRPFGEESFSSLAFSQDGKTLLAVVPGEKMRSQVEATLKQLFSDMQAMEKLSVSDAELSFILDEGGNFSQQVMSYSAELTAEGKSYSLDIDTTVGYPDPGKDHTVRLPEDLDSYQEVSQ